MEYYLSEEDVLLFILPLLSSSHFSFAKNLITFCFHSVLRNEFSDRSLIQPRDVTIFTNICATSRVMRQIRLWSQLQRFDSTQHMYTVTIIFFSNIELYLTAYTL